MPQRQIDWGEESLKAACRRWDLSRAETRLMLLALGTAGKSQVLEGESCWVIDASLRGVAKIVNVSHEAVRKALQRLELNGLAVTGRKRSGTRIVLCIGRLFDSPDPPGDAAEGLEENFPELPKKPGAESVNRGVNRVSTAPSVSVRESIKPSVPVSVSVTDKASGVPNGPPNFWRRKDLLPWSLDRFRDDDLVTLDRRMLRVLFDEAVRTRRLASGDAKSFLAAAFHAATHPGVEGWRAKCFAGRVKNKRFRGLTEAAWEWAQSVLQAKRDQGREVSGLGDVLAELQGAGQSNG